MRETVILFETAKLAYLKGFNIETGNSDYMIDGNNIGRQGYCVSCSIYIKAPSQSVLQKWLRELDTPIIVTPTTDFVAWQVEIQHPDKGLITIDKNVEDKWFNSYEESLEYGLIEALNIK